MQIVFFLFVVMAAAVKHRPVCLHGLHAHTPQTHRDAHTQTNANCFLLVCCHDRCCHT